MIRQHQLTELNDYGNLLAGNGGGDPLQKVQRSIHYMVANLNRPLQVSTLAAQANVSPSHFFALFKQATGCPPMDYFTKLRMRYARQLLESTTARVKEVAAAVGYDDPFYFSRVFKSVSAVAPVHYRGLGLEMRREINDQLDQLEPKEPWQNVHPRRADAPGRLPAKVSLNYNRPARSNPATANNDPS